MPLTRRQCNTIASCTLNKYIPVQGDSHSAAYTPNRVFILAGSGAHIAIEVAALDALFNTRDNMHLVLCTRFLDEVRSERQAHLLELRRDHLRHTSRWWCR